MNQYLASEEMQSQQKDQKQKDFKKQIDIVSGVFPSFVYFPIKNILFDQIYVKDIQGILLRQKVNYQKLDNLHLSISKTFKLQQRYAKSFIQQLTKFFKFGQLPIILIFDQADILQNFIVLKCAKISSVKINQYTKKLNDFLIKHTFEPYFEDPIFHVSLFRIAEQDRQKIRGQLNKVKVSKKGFCLSKIVLKIGNKILPVKEN